MASIKKMTPWFPASTPPERAGVYQVKGSIIPMYSKWNGEHWFRTNLSIGQARVEYYRSTAMYSTAQPAFWRGFTNEQ